MAILSKKQTLAYRMELTAWFGLAIFALGLLSQAIVFVVSWSDFMHQSFMPYRDLPAYCAGWLFSALAAIAPPAVAFFAGDTLAKPRAKYEPLYNGVLFAFLAIWVSAALSSMYFSFVFVPLTLIVPYDYLQYLPQLLALGVVIVLAYAYGKKYKHVALHDFKPYQFLLIGCMALLFFMSVVTLVTSPQVQSVELYAVAVIGTVVSLGMIVVPYVFSREVHSVTRLTHACVAGSIGIWSLAAMDAMTVYVPGWASLQVIVPCVAALAAWVVYIYLLHRHQG